MFGSGKFPGRLKRTSRARQGGFIHMFGSGRAALPKRWNYRDWFRNNEQGLVYEAYDPNTLLVRRNWIERSEQPANAYWAKTSATAVDGAYTSADGKSLGSLTEVVGSSTHEIRKNTLAVVPGETLTWECVLKALPGSAQRYLRLQVNDSATATNGFRALFNCATGAVTVAAITFGTGATALSGTSTPLGNDEYLVRISGTLSEASASCVFFLQEATTFTATYTGDGASGIYVGGIQLSRGALTAYQKVTDWSTEYLAATLAQCALFQDDAAKTPVTAVGQSIGFVMDSRFGKIRGAEMVTGDSANFTGGTVGSWVTSTGFASTASGATNEFVVTLGVTNGRQILPMTCVIGKTYEVTCNGRVGSGAGTAIVGHTTSNTGGLGAFTPASTTSTTAVPLRFAFVATATTHYIVAGASAGSAADTMVFDNFSMKELPGNHGIQATAASKPKLEARYNLFTKSEQFDDAAWLKTEATVSANTVAAPNGLLTADSLIDALTNNVHRVSEAVTVSAGTSLVISCAFKRNNYNFVSLSINNAADSTAWVGAKFNLLTNTVGTTAVGGGGGIFTSATITALGNDWYLCVLKGSVQTGTTINGYIALAGDSSGPFTSARGTDAYLGVGSTVYLWGADLRTSADAALNIPAYQRVNTATDYDTAGFPHYFLFDGFDDNWATAGNVDFTGTSKLTLVAGITKLSDAAQAFLIESSTSGANNDGTFSVRAPNSAASTYTLALRGTGGIAGQVAFATTTAPAYAAPINSVLSTGYDIAGADVTTEFSLQVDGVSPAVTNPGITDSGTGNFGSYVIYNGRRGGTTGPFNGRQYRLIVRGAATPSAQIAKAQRDTARLMRKSI
jgi:hypothetical protein